jgi:hypothetical protein
VISEALNYDTLFEALSNQAKDFLFDFSRSLLSGGAV